MVHRPTTETYLRMQGYGFWVRTKLAPYRAVRWEHQTNGDGRPSYRGKNWVEVLPHGEDREAERFFAADVELAGPHEALAYYPATHEMICGWEWWDRPGEYCPRKRVAEEPFCPKCMTEMNEERNL